MRRASFRAALHFLGHALSWSVTTGILLGCVKHLQDFVAFLAHVSSRGVTGDILN